MERNLFNDDNVNTVSTVVGDEKTVVEVRRLKRAQVRAQKQTSRPTRTKRTIPHVMKLRQRIEQTKPTTKLNFRANSQEQGRDQEN